MRTVRIVRSDRLTMAAFCSSNGAMTASVKRTDSQIISVVGFTDGSDDDYEALLERNKLIRAGWGRAVPPHRSHGKVSATRTWRMRPMSRRPRQPFPGCVSGA